MRRLLIALFMTMTMGAVSMAFVACGDGGKTTETTKETAPADAGAKDAGAAEKPAGG